MKAEISEIIFYGDELITLKHEGEPHIAMKPVCESLGIDWEGQRQRIKRDEILCKGAFIMKVPSKGGHQDTLFLPSHLFQGWLFGVSSSRVSAPVRAKLIKYKEECFKALSDYWTLGAASRVSQAQKEAHEIDKLDKETFSKARQGSYMMLERKFAKKLIECKVSRWESKYQLRFEFPKIEEMKNISV